MWIETGFIKKTNRFIDVSLLSNHLGIQLCSALTVFHALTGCDYTTAFYRKGKIKPSRILEKKHLEFVITWFIEHNTRNNNKFHSRAYLPFLFCARL
jgi:hypothetical protein